MPELSVVRENAKIIKGRQRDRFRIKVEASRPTQALFGFGLRPRLVKKLARITPKKLALKQAMKKTMRTAILVGMFCTGTAVPGVPEVYSGELNLNSGYGAVIMGGYSNTVAATATDASLMGGDSNKIDSPQSVLVGGANNWAKGNSAELETLFGGSVNRVESKQASLVGGRTNRARARYSSIGGGYNNLVTGRFGGVAGGTSNTVRGKYGSCLGSYGAVRKDNSLIVNLLGSRKVLDTPNTIAMWGDKFFINGHDLDEVIVATSRRERRLGAALVHHVSEAPISKVSDHAHAQAQLLSRKIDELREAVLGLKGDVAESAAHTEESRRKLKLREFAGALKPVVVLPSFDRSMETAPTTLDADGHSFLRADTSSTDDDETVEQKTLPNEQEMKFFPRSRFLRADTTPREGDEMEDTMMMPGTTERKRIVIDHHEFNWAQSSPPQSKFPIPPSLLAKWKASRAAWHRRERSRRLRRRHLTNTNSDYPKDGTMEQEYHETVTARMDDIDSRLASTQDRLATQETYMDAGQLIGDFDCTTLERETYGFGPCNICGDIPRLQFRASDPGSSGPAVLLCDGSGEFTTDLELLTSGSWVALV